MTAKKYKGTVLSVDRQQCIVKAYDSVNLLHVDIRLKPAAIKAVRPGMLVTFSLPPELPWHMTAVVTV